MNIQNIVQISKGEYAVISKDDLVLAAKVVNVGDKVLCLSNKVVYIYMDVNKWISLNEEDPENEINVAEVGM